MKLFSHIKNLDVLGQSGSVSTTDVPWTFVIPNSEDKPIKSKAEREYKDFPVSHVKVLDETLGVVEAIVAVMGNVDLGLDVIMNGAFTKTISERGNKIRVLDNHQMDSVTNVIGKVDMLREVAKDQLPSSVLMDYPTATGGLYVRAQFAINESEAARTAFNLLRTGFIDEWSIGYDPIQVAFEPRIVDGEEKQVRLLREVRLWECSPVIWGMNPATATVAAKNADEHDSESAEDAEQKGAVGKQSFPLADRGRAWNSQAAVRRCRAWAGGSSAEDISWSKYRRCFLWYDAEGSDQFGSYKLPVVDIIDGLPHIIPRAVFAVAGVLEGARGGVNVPDNDKASIRRTVASYYSAMREKFNDDSIVPPWEKSAQLDMLRKLLYDDGVLDDLATRIADTLREQIATTVQSEGDDLSAPLGTSEINNTEEIEVVEPNDEDTTVGSDETLPTENIEDNTDNTSMTVEEIEAERLALLAELESLED